MATGWQTVLRSKNIYVPYEDKIVHHQGDTDVNGPHQWQWHANSEALWSFPTAMGFLCMNPVILPKEIKNLWEAPNLLLQKMPSEEFTVTTKLIFHHQYDGEKTGLIVMGRDYAHLALEQQEDSQLFLNKRPVTGAENGAVKWFENHKMEGVRVETEIDQDGHKNKVVIQDENAPPLWGRFYDLETGQPFFCDRDGIKKNALAEIGYDRRNGYRWYVDRPEKGLSVYPAWRKKWDKK